MWVGGPREAKKEKHENELTGSPLEGVSIIARVRLMPRMMLMVMRAAAHLFSSGNCDTSN